MGKKVLTIGRHGIKDHFFGIMPQSMVQVYFSTKTFIPKGKSLVLSSPIERALVTAKIRAHGWKAPCKIMPELHESYLENDYCGHLMLLYQNCYEAVAESECEYDHLHMMTHLPIIDELGFPSCAEGNLFKLSADSWEEMFETLKKMKFDSEKLSFSNQEAVDFYNSHPSLQKLFVSPGAFAVEAFCKEMDKLVE